MSDTFYCLMGLLLCCLFVLVLIYILKASMPRTIGVKEAYDLFAQAKKDNNLLPALMAAALFIFTTGYLGAVVAMSGAAFSALAAMCGGLNVEQLKVIRDMLLDLYRFLERLLHH